VPKDVSEDLSHSDTRLSVQLNGFEMHIYNRSHLYQVTCSTVVGWNHLMVVSMPVILLKNRYWHLFVTSE
jgi:hypothetical protein